MLLKKKRLIEHIPIKIQELTKYIIGQLKKIYYKIIVYKIIYLDIDINVDR